MLLCSDMVAGIRVPFDLYAVSEEQSFHFVLCKERYIFLCSVKRTRQISYSKLLAKILQQIKGDDNPIPIEILAQAPPKEPTNDAMPNFVQAYLSHSRVATLVKETQTGKLIKEWEAALASANSKPELVDMAPSISSMLAVKDDEELVGNLY